MTGTINSGGIVGLVGGIPSKIDAAKNSGIREVFIPGVSLLSNHSDINVYDLPTFKVKPINTVDSIMKEILGKEDYNSLKDEISNRKIRSESEIASEDEYYRLMEDISDFMCDRTYNLASSLKESINSNCIEINKSDVYSNWDSVLKNDFESYLKEVTYNFISSDFNKSFINFSNKFDNLSSKMNLSNYYNLNSNYLTYNDFDVESFYEFLDLNEFNLSFFHFENNISNYLKKYDSSFNFFNDVSFKLFNNMDFNERVNFVFLSKNDRIDFIKDRINTVNSSLIKLDGDFLCKNPLGSIDVIESRYKSSLEMKQLGNYYSRASFCYSANIELSQNYFFTEKPNLENLIDETNQTYFEMKDELENKEVNNYFDFQARMISNDRLIEAKENLDESFEIFNELDDSFKESLNESDFNFNLINNFFYDDLSNELSEINLTDRMIQNYIDLYNTNYLTELINYQSLTRSIERLEGINGWFILFESNVENREIDDDILKRSCLEKISQAEERFHSISNYLPDYSDNTILNNAYDEYHSNDYVNCIYQASMAKASYDLVLGTIGIENKNIIDLIDIRLPVAKEIIDDSRLRGFFPIMGYNYYEYSKSLRDSDEFSALTYSEYAIELSSLDMFFYEGKSIPLDVDRRVCMDNNLDNKRDKVIRYTLIFVLIIFIILTLFLFFELSKVKELKNYISSKEKYDKEETVVRIDE